MPELPEIETTRRCLAPVLEGSVIVHAEVRHPRLARRQGPAAEVALRLRGRRVLSMGRLGKFLLTELDQELTWVTHLGMSGRMQLADAAEIEAPHTHVVVKTDRGREVRMVDPRTFGTVSVLTPEELRESTIHQLGPDALEALPPTGDLAQRLRGRRAAIKSLLLDQRFLAGLGNIYADEVLHRAGVRPHRSAGSLLRREVDGIREAVHPVLEAGLLSGGTSLEDMAYLLPDGRAGGNLPLLRVYGRSGQPCPECGSEIRRSVIGGRSAHWCPRCQE